MDATIKEGNVGRSFSPVDKLKINLQNDGGESLWVPEDSVQLDELYTSTNGTYYAAPRDIYGWGVVTVDVSNSIDEPDNLYGDEDQDEDSPDPDDWPGWDDLDPDLKDDFDDWMDDSDNLDPDDWPGWDDLDPGLQDDFDDWMDDSDDEPGGDDEDEDWDDWADEPDEDWDEDGDEGDEEDEDDWEDDDWGDEDDDWGDGDEEWGDDRITDGDDYDYIDDDGNLVEEECPASIKVVLPPNKTDYTDGDSINLTGLYVYAYNEDGSVFRGGKYRDGRVPNNELTITPTIAEFDEATASGEEARSDYIDGWIPVGGGGGGWRGESNIYHHYFHIYESGASYTLRIANATYYSIGASNQYGAVFSERAKIIDAETGDTVDDRTIPHTATYSVTYEGKTAYYCPYEYASFFDDGGGPERNPRPDNPGQIAWTLVYGERRKEETSQQQMHVHWNSPCGIEQLSTSFDISVKGKDPDGGHWGGTTISGNYGGSHYSGKF